VSENIYPYFVVMCGLIAISKTEKYFYCRNAERKSFYEMRSESCDMLVTLLGERDIIHHREESKTRNNITWLDVTGWMKLNVLDR